MDKITLPEELLETLPEPDSGGVIRVTAGLRMNEDGTARLVELNDVSIAQSEDKKDDTGSVAKDIYRGI